MMYFTSDLHFGHDRTFLYEPRGFKSIEEHDKAIIENFNKVLTPDDELWVLGDGMLGDNQHGLECIRQIPCKIFFIRGNHDTDERMKLYEKEPNINYMGLAYQFKYKKYHFYASHYHTDTANIEKESLHQCLINLYGHTHQKTNFWMDMPFYYHVGLDSHNNFPVSIDQIIEDMKNKVNECKEFL